MIDSIVNGLEHCQSEHDYEVWVNEVSEWTTLSPELVKKIVDEQGSKFMTDMFYEHDFPYQNYYRIKGEVNETVKKK